MKAYLLINCSLDSTKNVIAYIKDTIPNSSVHHVFGAYDILVSLITESPDTMKDTIMWKIRKHKDVVSVLTLMDVTPGVKVDQS